MRDASKEFVKLCAIMTQNVAEVKFAKTDCARLDAEVILFVMTLKLVLINSAEVCIFPITILYL